MGGLVLRNQTRNPGLAGPPGFGEGTRRFVCCFKARADLAEHDLAEARRDTELARRAHAVTRDHHISAKAVECRASLEPMLATLKPAACCLHKAEMHPAKAKDGAGGANSGRKADRAPQHDKSHRL